MFQIEVIYVLKICKYYLIRRWEDEHDNPLTIETIIWYDRLLVIASLEALFNFMSWIGLLIRSWFKTVQIVFLLFHQSGPVIPMAVPSSYNDVGVDASLRDFVGWVWYDREFYVSRDWATKRVVLRVESAHYYAVVVSIANHYGYPLGITN